MTVDQLMWAMKGLPKGWKDAEIEVAQGLHSDLVILNHREEEMLSFCVKRCNQDNFFCKSDDLNADYRQYIENQ